MALTAKRKLFVAYYLGEANGNATAAARMAGYADRAEGSRLLKMPEIRALVDKRVESVAMVGDKILSLLAEQARGTMGDFVSFDTTGQPFIDLRKAVEQQKMHLIRKLRVTGDGAVEVELYDAQTALVHLGRYFKLFTDKLEVANTGPVEIVYVNDWRE